MRCLPAMSSDTQEAQKQTKGGDAAGDAGRVSIPSAEQQGKLIQRVAPAYPTLARQAKIQGTVVLQAVLATDGTVKEVQLLSGPPLLVQAGIDAVRQWRYRPSLLCGKPAEVVTKIEVIFALQ
jgi:protein TonB